MPVAEDVCAPGGFTREVGATPAEFERGLRNCRAKAVRLMH